LEESKGKGSRTNRFLLSDEERIKEDEYFKRTGMMSLKESQPVEPVEIGRENYIRRAVERAAEELERPVEEQVSENYFITTTQTPIFSEPTSDILVTNRA